MVKWFRDNVHFVFNESYTQFFHSCNWYDFKLIHIESEYCPHMGTVDFQAHFLGLGFTVTVIYNRNTEGRAILDERVADFMRQIED